MNASTWISGKLSSLLGRKAETETPPAAGTAPRKAVPRSVQERLDASFRSGNEAMSPRLLRRTLEALQGVIDPKISEVEGGRLAAEIAGIYARADRNRRHDMWLLMSEKFGQDKVRIEEERKRYEAKVGTPDELVAEVRLRRATVSPRRRLLQRFANFPEGLSFLIDLRAEMQASLKSDRRLAALDIELEYLFATWFDVGFLDLQRITWDSPASLVERLIKYEAVHDIRSWADVKNRLDSDRRCYGFFHPRMPGIPLIFVEVALLEEIPASIEPLLDEGGAQADLQKASVAVFYSISNTQTGLRGVAFGDSLIKRVVGELRSDFPRLKTFVTLSPIPGYRNWLIRHLASSIETLETRWLRSFDSAFPSKPAEKDAVNQHRAESFLRASDLPARDLENTQGEVLREMHLRLAARYLQHFADDAAPFDPVARFHLGNGARIERLNWMADPSPKGMKQSYGLMVNYLYDLKRLDRNRALLAKRKAAASAEVEKLG